MNEFTEFSARKIETSPWKHITTTTNLDMTSIQNIFTILIEKDGEYSFLVDSDEKIFDISIMPLYIREDWIRYNKKPLNLELINNQIKQLSNNLNLFEQEIMLLNALKREMLINQIL
jgi:hypothetical protein